MKVLDWEVDALYFSQRQDRGPDMAARKVVERLETCSSASKDCRFFLGNISNHPTNFTIVGLWYPKRAPSAAEEPGLFD
jgi:hypothetical protein